MAAALGSVRGPQASRPDYGSVCFSSFLLSHRHNEFHMPHLGRHVLSQLWSWDWVHGEWWSEVLADVLPLLKDTKLSSHPSALNHSRDSLCLVSSFKLPLSFLRPLWEPASSNFHGHHFVSAWQPQVHPDTPQHARLGDRRAGNQYVWIWPKNKNKTVYTVLLKRRAHCVWKPIKIDCHSENSSRPRTQNFLSSIFPQAHTQHKQIPQTHLSRFDSLCSCEGKETPLAQTGPFPHICGPRQTVLTV